MHAYHIDVVMDMHVMVLDGPVLTWMPSQPEHFDTLGSLWTIQRCCFVYCTLDGLLGFLEAEHHIVEFWIMLLTLSCTCMVADRQRLSPGKRARASPWRSRHHTRRAWRAAIRKLKFEEFGAQESHIQCRIKQCSLHCLHIRIRICKVCKR